MYTLIFFNDTATTEIYTLSLHDALPIFFLVGGDAGDTGGDFDDAGLPEGVAHVQAQHPVDRQGDVFGRAVRADRKSTRLNSSHANISYAVFCLKKKTIVLCYFSPFLSLI